MNNRSKEIIEEAISQGKWVWLEIDDNSNSLYLEFENLKLSSRPILDNSYRGELAIRFGQNIYLALFFNKKGTEPIRRLEITTQPLDIASFKTAPQPS